MMGSSSCIILWTWPPSPPGLWFLGNPSHPWCFPLRFACFSLMFSSSLIVLWLLPSIWGWEFLVRCPFIWKQSFPSKSMLAGDPGPQSSPRISLLPKATLPSFLVLSHLGHRCQRKNIRWECQPCRLLIYQIRELTHFFEKWLHSPDSSSENSLFCRRESSRCWQIKSGAQHSFPGKREQFWMLDSQGSRYSG